MKKDQSGARREERMERYQRKRKKKGKRRMRKRKTIKIEEGGAHTFNSSAGEAGSVSRRPSWFQDSQGH